MSRHYVDPVEVLRRDDRPVQFLWRNRLYLVRAVLAHWTEAGGWWRAGSAAAIASGDVRTEQPLAPAGGTTGLRTRPIPASPKWAQRAWGEPAPDVGAAVGPAGVDDREREYWRVEAAAGRGSGTGVFDLCFDWLGNCWTLARALD
ncbi:MAG: DUF6504 family protein [Actinomycetota bacterium]|nr:DUF6504 family protein [Actinomycetota bacterium]